MTFAGGPAEPFEQAAPAAARALPPPAVIGARQLVGTSFDLLVRSGRQLRPASFYVGLVVLGTAGALVLGLLGLAASGELDPIVDAMFDPTARVNTALQAWVTVLALVAVAGVVVATVESQAMAITVLAARHVDRFIATRDAVWRSRQIFWLLFAATLIVSVPASLIQELVGGAFGDAVEAGLIAALAVSALVQAPFVYAPSGVVLGDVGPVEALRRSVRVFRARPLAGLLVTVLPVLFQFILGFALGVGLDVLLRVVDVLGLGVTSGPVGLAILVALTVMAVFSIGTLIFTAAALSVAPQVVMFVGLTHATMGLDRVRPLDAWAPQRPDDGRPFRWLTRPMLGGFILAAVSLAALLASIDG